MSAQGRLPSGILVNSIATFERLVQFASRRPAAACPGLVVACFGWDPFAPHLPDDITMPHQNEGMVEGAFDALAAGRQQDGAVTPAEPVRVGTACAPRWAPRRKRLIVDLRRPAQENRLVAVGGGKRRELLFLAKATRGSEGGATPDARAPVQGADGMTETGPARSS